jgi:hypothetical protein
MQTSTALRPKVVAIGRHNSLRDPTAGNVTPIRDLHPPGSPETQGGRAPILIATRDRFKVTDATLCGAFPS